MATGKQPSDATRARPLARKSLLLVVSSNRRRGAEVFGERLADGFTSRGWDVDFIALSSAESGRTVRAAPLTDTEHLGRLDLAVVGKLRQKIARDRPTALLANGGPTLRYTAAAHALTNPRKRPLFGYSSIGEPRYWLRTPNHIRLARFLHSRPDIVLAVSRMTRDQLVSDLGVSPDRVHVAPTGVAPEYFAIGSRTDPHLRLLFLGSLSAEKDPMAALDVVDRLGDHVHLRFVGSGPLAPEIRTRTDERNLGERVEFTGSVEDVRPHLEWADLLILPSRTEGLPGAALEAGAAGVPTIAYDVGGTSETMIPDVTGIVVAPGDIEALTAAVSSIDENRARLAEMGGAGRIFVEEHYALESAIDRYDSIMSKSLSGSETS